MKSLKQADLYFQLLFFAFAAIALIISSEKINPLFFLVGLILVQLISIVIHKTTGPRPWKLNKWRKVYQYGIMLTLILVAIALLQSSSARTGDKDDKYSMAGLGTFLAAIIPAALCVLFYIVITWKEYQLYRKNNAV